MNCRSGLGYTFKQSIVCDQAKILNPDGQSKCSPPVWDNLNAHELCFFNPSKENIPTVVTLASKRTEYDPPSFLCPLLQPGVGFLNYAHLAQGKAPEKTVVYRVHFDVDSD